MAPERLDFRIMGTGEVNIEEIMNGIREEIKEKGYSADMLSFSDVTGVFTSDPTVFDKRVFSDYLSYLNTAYRVPDARPLYGNPLVVFIKKVIRKLTLFVMRPAVDHQSEYNSFIARTFNMVDCYMNENRSELSETELAKKLDILELKLKTASMEIDRLNERITQLEAHKNI